MSDRIQITAEMQADAQRAAIEIQAAVRGYTKEDVSKLYEKYGPYTYTLFNTAVYNPTFYAAQTNDTQTYMQNYSNINPVKDLFEKDLTAKQISLVVGKPELEVAANINEHQASLAARKQIDDTYKTICKGENKPTTSIDSLLAAGVKPEDFQALLNEKPEFLGNIGGGPTCEALTKSANNVKTEYVNGKAKTGNCKAGVDTIHINAGLKIDSLHTSVATQAMEQDRIEHSYQKKSKGGGNVDEGLLASGNYIVLNVENKAYLKSKNSPENKEMNKLFLTCRDGVTMSVDSIEDRTIPQANTAGGTYGHTAVRKSRGNPWGCDFDQEEINFARYGKTAHACFPKDAEVSEAYAKMLIEKAQERTGQCLSVEENTKNYEATKTARQNEQIAEQKAKAAVNNNRFNRRVQTRKPYRKKTKTSRTTARKTQARRTTGRSGR